MNSSIDAEMVVETSAAAHVRAALRDVAHPTVRIVAFLIVLDFEVPHLQLGHIEHGNLEVETDGADFFASLVRRLRLERDFADECMLLTSGELLEAPLGHIVHHLVLSMLALHTLGQLERNGGRVSRQRKLSHELSSDLIVRLRGLDLQRELQLVLRQLIDERVDAIRRLIVTVYAIVHDEELTIGRRNGQCAQRIPISRVNALVE